MLQISQGKHTPKGTACLPQYNMPDSYTPCSAANGFLILQASSKDCSEWWWWGSSLSVELKSYGALQSLSSWVLGHRPPIRALCAVASVEGCYQAHAYSPIDGTRWNPRKPTCLPVGADRTVVGWGACWS